MITNAVNRFEKSRKRFLCVENDSPSLAIVTLLTGLVMAICVLMSEFRASSIACVVALCIYCGVVFAKRSDLFVRYLAFVFVVFANITGCLIVEFVPLSLTELLVTSFFSGSLPLLVMSRWIFLVIIFTYSKRGNAYLIKAEDVAIRKRKWVTTLSAVMLVLALILFAQVVMNPSFATGSNSFFYEQEYGVSGIWKIVSNVMSYAIIIPAMAIRQGDKKLGSSVIVVYLLYLFWTGNKFGNFFSVVTFLLLVFYDKILARGNRFVLKAGITCLAIIPTMVVFSLFAYSLTSQNNPVDYLFSRTAQQGQLWWRTYQLYSEETHLNDFSNEIDALVSRSEGAENNIGSKNGVYGIMYATVPKSIVDTKLATGSQYTEAGYAASFYYFGLAGPLLFSVIMGWIIVKLTGGLIRSVSNESPIDACIYARLISISQTALSMFLFAGYFDALSIVSFAYLFIMYLRRQRSAPGRGNKSIEVIDSREGCSIGK